MDDNDKNPMDEEKLIYLSKKENDPILRSTLDGLHKTKKTATAFPFIQEPFALFFNYLHEEN